MRRGHFFLLAYLKAIHTMRRYARICADTQVSVVIECIEINDDVHIDASLHRSALCVNGPLHSVHVHSGRLTSYHNKSSAVAEMGDRLATIDMGRKVGAAVPLSVWELDRRLTQCRLGRGLPPYQVAS